jgi:anti-sigma regulatory factor (Ser/Thr protein kinase)
VTDAALTLPPEPESVPRARRFVCAALAALGADGACDAAETLVSELATNVVLHARTSFTVEVKRDGAAVRVEVLDSSPAAPRSRDYGVDATTGRGLRLIASLSTHWGVEPAGAGKSVWFELPADGAMAFVAAWDDEDVDVDVLLSAYGDDGDDGGVVAPRSLGRAA